MVQTGTNNPLKPRRSLLAQAVLSASPVTAKYKLALALALNVDLTEPNNAEFVRDSRTEDLERYLGMAWSYTDPEVMEKWVEVVDNAVSCYKSDKGKMQPFNFL